MEHRKIGFAFCGSFCTYSQAMEVLERVQSRYGDVLPIVSEAGAATDTRFGAAHDFMREMERICGRRVVDSIAKAEPHWAQASAGCAGHLSLHGQHPGQAGKRRHGHHGYHGGQGSPAQRGAGGALPCHQRRSGGLGQEYRRTAGQEKRLFRPLPAGRSRQEAHLPVADFPWSQPLSTRRWRAASSSPCCLDRRRRIKKHTAPGVAGGRCVL